MDTGAVKITKTGNNGIQQMSYERKVADFNTFIKSPEKFFKGMAVKTTDKVASKPGDKDYKQLFGKLKMIGEKINTLSAKVATDPAALTQLNEAIAELNAINKILEDANVAEANAPAKTDWKDSLETSLRDYFNKMPDDQKDQLVAAVEKAQPTVKDETAIQQELEPNEQKAQDVLKSAGDQINESMAINEGAREWLGKAIDVVLATTAYAGVGAFLVGGIWTWVLQHGGIMQTIAEVGGISAAVAAALYFIKLIVDEHVKSKKANA